MATEAVLTGDRPLLQDLWQEALVAGASAGVGYGARRVYQRVRRRFSPRYRGRSTFTGSRYQGPGPRSGGGFGGRFFETGFSGANPRFRRHQ